MKHMVQYGTKQYMVQYNDFFFFMGYEFRETHKQTKLHQNKTYSYDKCQGDVKTIQTDTQNVITGIIPYHFNIRI